MSKTIWLVGLVAVALTFAACQSSSALVGDLDAFVKAYDLAKADGVIDAAEMDALFVQFEGLVGSMRGFAEEAEGVGLEEIVAGAVTVASTLLLGRALPNGVLLGKKAAAALDRPGMAHDSARSSNPS